MAAVGSQTRRSLLTFVSLPDSVQADLISPESGQIEISEVQQSQQKRSAASSSESALLAALSTNALEESISVGLREPSIRVMNGT